MENIFKAWLFLVLAICNICVESDGLEQRDRAKDIKVFSLFVLNRLNVLNFFVILPSLALWLSVCQ